MGKTKFFKSVFILLYFVSFMSAVSAQDVLDQSVSTNAVLPKKIDFIEAIMCSLENNNNLKALRKGLSATERDIGIARSTMLPHFRFNENFMVTNNPIEAFAIKLNQTRATAGDLAFGTLDYPGATTNFLTSGLLEQKILDIKDIIKIKIAKKEYSANGYIFLRKEEDLINEVAQAYLKVMETQDLINSVEKTIVEEKEHVDIAQKKFNDKSGYEADILRAKSQVDQDEIRLISLHRNINVLKRNLCLFLGIECDVETTNSVPDIKVQAEDYYKTLSAYRNDIKAMEIKVESAKKGIKAAQAEWYPTLNAFASYNFYSQYYPFGGQGNNYVAGANFRWDILDGNRRKYDILKAKDKEVEAEEYLIWHKKNVDFKVYEAYSRIDEYKKNLELSIIILKDADENTRTIEEGWKKSQFPFVSLVDAQNNLELARFDVIKNEYNLKKAIISLIYESGVICQELGLN